MRNLSDGQLLALIGIELFSILILIFSNTIMNILRNFFPHESIVSDDKDPQWFNKAIKFLIQEKNTRLEYRKNNNNI